MLRKFCLAQIMFCSCLLVLAVSPSVFPATYYYDFTVEQLSFNDFDDREPRINDSGAVVWYGPYSNDPRIYRYDGDGTAPYQYTTSAAAYYVDINESGDIVWEEDTGGWSVKYDDGSGTVQTFEPVIYNYKPRLNERSNGQVDIVWNARNAGADLHEIYVAWDVNSSGGSTPVRLTTNSVYDIQQEINNNGNIVWQQGIDGSYDIVYYDGSIHYITTNGLSNTNPYINNNDVIVWCGKGTDGTDSGDDYEIFMYDGISIIQLTHNDYDDRTPVINDLNQIVWSGDEEILFWDGDIVTQITDNTYLDGAPL